MLKPNKVFNIRMTYADVQVLFLIFLNVLSRKYSKLVGAKNLTF